MSEKFVIVADWIFVLKSMLWVTLSFIVGFSTYALLSKLDHTSRLWWMAIAVFVFGIALFFMLRPFGTYWYYNQISNEDIAAFFTGRH